MLAQHARASGAAHLARALPVPEQRLKGLRERRGVARPREQAVLAVADETGDAADVAPDDGALARVRLGEHHAEALRGRGGRQRDDARLAVLAHEALVA